jgi:hypothetical protein
MSHSSASIHTPHPQYLAMITNLSITVLISLSYSSPHHQWRDELHSEYVVHGNQGLVARGQAPLPVLVPASIGQLHHFPLVVSVSPSSVLKKKSSNCSPGAGPALCLLALVLNLFVIGCTWVVPHLGNSQENLLI